MLFFSALPNESNHSFSNVYVVQGILEGLYPLVCGLYNIVCSDSIVMSLLAGAVKMLVEELDDRFP